MYPKSTQGVWSWLPADQTLSVPIGYTVLVDDLQSMKKRHVTGPVGTLAFSVSVVKASDSSQPGLSLISSTSQEPEERERALAMYPQERELRRTLIYLPWTAFEISISLGVQPGVINGTDTQRKLFNCRFSRLVS